MPLFPFCSKLEDGRIAVDILLTYDESFNLTLTPLNEETKDGYLGNISIDINFYTPTPSMLLHLFCFIYLLVHELKSEQTQTIHAAENK